MNDDIKCVRAIKYTGTVESYNEFIEHMWRDKMNHHIWHLDDHGEITLKFTGTILDAITGIRYKPGDHYFVDFEDGCKHE